MPDRDIDKIVDEAQTGTEADKKKAKCAKAAAKVARQPEGSTRRKIAQRALDKCREAQTTDSNN